MMQKFIFPDPLATPSSRRMQLILLWLSALAWTWFIFKLSGPNFGFSTSGVILRTVLNWLHLNVTPETEDVLNALIRKCAHFTVYAALSILWFRAIRGLGKEKNWTISWMMA